MRGLGKVSDKCLVIFFTLRLALVIFSREGRVSRRLYGE